VEGVLHHAGDETGFHRFKDLEFEVTRLFPECCWDKNRTSTVPIDPKSLHLQAFCDYLGVFRLETEFVCDYTERERFAFLCKVVVFVSQMHFFYYNLELFEVAQRVIIYQNIVSVICINPYPF
jgi:hypothetical protein